MSGVQGYVFRNDEPLWGGDALEPVRSALDAGRLRDLNGSFGAIISGHEHTTLVTDRLGSHPIFYAKGRNGWVVDFDFWEVVRQLPQVSIDREAAYELLTFSYVLGSRTLVAQVREAPPGSRVDLGVGGESVERYWTVQQAHRRHGPDSSDVASVINRTADRTAALARSVMNDHPVGLALSGGRDSRLIGWMLRSRGLDIECFTTASLGESAPAVEQAAAALDAPLATFRPWFESGATPDDAMVRALSPTTLFGVANHTLTLAHERSPGETHVAGHLGDIPVGSYIDSRSLLASARGGDSAVGLVLSKHRRVRPETLRAVLGTDAEAILRDRVAEVLAGCTSTLRAERRFILDQRQRRFILRDNLAARQQFSTFLPLMDAEWLDLWESAPEGSLMGTTLYERTLADEVFVGRWRPLAMIPANGRPLGALGRRHAVPVLAEDLATKVRRQIQLRTGRAAAVYTQQVDVPADLDVLADILDVPATRARWSALGWDAQRSVYTLISVVQRLGRSRSGTSRPSGSDPSREG